jgi:hypothetical protein
MSLNDPLSFFDGDVQTPAAAAPAPADAPSNVPAVVDTPAAPAAPTTSADAAVSGAPDDSFPNAPAGFVPIRALQDERSKRQTLEDVVKGFGKPQPAPQPAAPAPQPRPVPQIGTPEHGQWLQDQNFQLQVSTKFDRSEMMATMAHGADKVAAAKEWAQAQQDPSWWMGVIESPDPYGRVIAEMNREADAKSWAERDQNDEWKAFTAWKEAQAAGQQPAAGGAPAAAPAAPKVITPSAAAAAAAPAKNPSTPGVKTASILATAAAGSSKPGEVATGHGEAFGGLFQK